jgi:hypothetical protein
MEKNDKNTDNNIIKMHTTTEPIPNKRTLKTKIIQDNITYQHLTKETTKKQKKWATFTYFGQETKQITNIFKDTYIKIVFKTTNNTQETSTTKTP